MDIKQFIITGRDSDKPRHDEFYTKTSESECIIDSETGLCASKKIVNKIVELAKVKLNKELPPIKALDVLKNETNCNSEYCVLQHLRDKKNIEPDIITNDLNTCFKTAGPRDSTALLSNYNIDQTLTRWGHEYKDFYPCPFSMIDFFSYPERYKFGRINLADLLYQKESYTTIENTINKGPFKTFACVLNTDVSTGRGKHWVCIFVDFRTPEWTIEYFNSTGNKPCKTVIDWMEQQRRNIREATGNDPKVLSVTNLVHQQANTECGVYSLYYIRARLDGLSYTFFTVNVIPDDKMVKFRKHIFRSL